MVSAVIVAVCNLFYPTIAKNMINGFGSSITLNIVFMNAALLLGIYVIKAVFQYIIGHWGHIIGVRMQADMRRDLFEKYESLPYNFFDEHKTGDLMSRLTSDLFEVSELAHHGPENIFLALLMLVGSFVMLVDVDLELTLVMFSVVPFIILFAVLSRRSMSLAMKNSRKQIEEVNVTLENSITGIRETKSYVAHHGEICKFDRENGKFQKYRTDAMHSLGSFHAIMELLQDLLYLVIVLEESFQIKFEDVGTATFATIGEVIDYIEARMK
jgi:ATP-binding cassette subfamily B protein